MAAGPVREVHALFPGTFDPVTLGHLDVLNRARSLFGRTTMAVASHHDKRQLFSLEERMELLEEVARDMPDVQVVALHGLLVEGCVELGVDVVVRGLRTAGDLDYERQMAHANRALLPTVETTFLLPAAELAHISSTLVRQIARMGGDCSSFVPPAVNAALKHHFESPGTS